MEVDNILTEIQQCQILLVNVINRTPGRPMELELNEWCIFLPWLLRQIGIHQWEIVHKNLKRDRLFYITYTVYYFRKAVDSFLDNLGRLPGPTRQLGYAKTLVAQTALILTVVSRDVPDRDLRRCAETLCRLTNTYWAYRAEDPENQKPWHKTINLANQRVEQAILKVLKDRLNNEARKWLFLDIWFVGALTNLSVAEGLLLEAERHLLKAATGLRVRRIFWRPLESLCSILSMRKNVKDT